MNVNNIHAWTVGVVTALAVSLVLLTLLGGWS